MDVFILLLLLFYGQIPTASSDMSSTHTQTVGLKENFAMSCNITGKQVVSWYLLNSRVEELTLLIYAEKTRTRKSLPFSYNADEQRLILKANSEITEATLTVREVGPNDLGLYFCGTKADFSETYFARPIRLQLEDADQKPKTKNEGKGDVSAVERVMMLVGVGAVALVFLLASIAAGRVIHRRAWRSGWAAGVHSAQRRSLKR